MSNIHASYYEPIYYPITGNIEPGNIDRAQSIDPSVTTNREEVNEIGRDGRVGYIGLSADVSYDVSQLDYGSIAFYQLLAGNAIKGLEGEDPITLRDYRTPYGDITAFLTDDNGQFQGTAHYPKLRLSSLGINIPGPEEMIERSFTMEGESAYIWQGDNKYYNYQKEIIDVSENPVFTLDETATEDPITGEWVNKVVRFADGETEELRPDQYTASSTEVEILDTNLVNDGDIFKIYYTSSETSESDLWTPNDEDPVALLGGMVSIFLYVPASGSPSNDDYIYRLQSCDITADLEREDLMELGNSNVVQRGVSDESVSIEVERTVENFTIEEILSGREPGFGKIDVNKLSDNVALIVKIYDSNDKSNFKYGIKCTGLTSSDIGAGASVDEYLNRTASLEGDNLMITKDELELGI